MSGEVEIQRAFTSLMGRKTMTIPVTVQSVDKAKGVCVVKDGELSFKVRLASVINEGDERFYLYPKVGSKLLIAPIEEDINRFHVVAFSEVENLYYKSGKVVLDIDSEGFLLKKENETLKQLMADLLAAIKVMKFTTNTGSTIQLVNIQDFIDVETRFNQFLKDS